MFKKISRRSFPDPQTASLSVVEFSEIPFLVRRIYWINDFRPNVTRGNHAHKSLNQLFMVTNGNLVLELYRGEQVTSISLNSKSDHILIPPGTWRVIKNPSSNAVVTVLADTPYLEADYIRDFTEYLEWFTENIAKDER